MSIILNKLLLSTCYECEQSYLLIPYVSHEQKAGRKPESGPDTHRQVSIAGREG